MDIGKIVSDIYEEALKRSDSGLNIVSRVSQVSEELNCEVGKLMCVLAEEERNKWS